MRWVTYTVGDDPASRIGVVQEDKVHGLVNTGPLLDLLGDDGQRLHEAGERAVRDPHEVRSLGDIRLLSPIPRPPSIRDSMSFFGHLRNARRALGGSADLEPVWSHTPAFYFTNPVGVLGAHDDVPVAPGSKWFDLELEVAAVIGRAGRDLHPDEAEQHIIGYTLMCDWSARDLQFREMQLMLGPAKGKDCGTTLGPTLVTVDELEPYRRDGRLAFELSATVNGEEITRGRLDDMDWSFGEVLSYASRGVELVPGDVIGSGTVPGGCMLEHVTQNPAEFSGWLKPGDVVSLRGEGLGETSQRIVAGAPVHRLRSGF